MGVQKEMTLGQKLEHFLQVDKLICVYDGKRLGPPWGYYKVKGYPQWPLGSWHWLKQFFGDDDVMRFCNKQEYLEFIRNGNTRPS